MQKYIRSNRHLHNLQNDIHNIRAALADTTEDIKSKVGDVISHSIQVVRDKSLDARDSVEDYVVKKPFKSLLFAGLIGVFIGYFYRK